MKSIALAAFHVTVAAVNKGFFLTLTLLQSRHPVYKLRYVPMYMVWYCSMYRVKTYFLDEIVISTVTERMNGTTRLIMHWAG